MMLSIAIGLLLFGCNKGEATGGKFNVPLCDNIEYININSNNENIKCTDKEIINKLMDEIYNSNITDN